MFEIIEAHVRKISFLLLVSSFILSSYYIPVIINSSLDYSQRRLTSINEEISEIQNSLIEFQSWEDKETALRIKYEIPLHLRNNTHNLLDGLSFLERNEVLTIKRKGLEALNHIDSDPAYSLTDMGFQQLEEQKKVALTSMKERLTTKITDRNQVTEEILDAEMKKSKFTLAMTFIQVLGLFFAYIAEK